MVHWRASCKPRTGTSKTVFFFMHPVTPMDVLPVPRTWPSPVRHVLCGRPIFRQDAALIFEKTLLDFGAWIRYAKEQLATEGGAGGWRAVAPWMFYRVAGRDRDRVDTPYGDPVDVVVRLHPPPTLWFQAAQPPGRGCCWSPCDAWCAMSSTPRTATRTWTSTGQDLAVGLIAQTSSRRYPCSPSWPGCAVSRRPCASASRCSRARWQGDRGCLRRPPDRGPTRAGSTRP